MAMVAHVSRQHIVEVVGPPREGDQPCTGHLLEVFRGMELETHEFSGAQGPELAA